MLSYALPFQIFSTSFLEKIVVQPIYQSSAFIRERSKNFIPRTFGNILLNKVKINFRIILGTYCNFLLANGSKYILYPPNSSSAPSPESTTFTFFRASRARKYKATAEGSATGSSKCHAISGSVLKYSSQLSSIC